MGSFAKHPDTATVFGIDYTKVLSTKATPPEVCQSAPSVAFDPTDTSDKLLVLGTASINTTDMIQPNNNPTVPANNGVAFACSGGTDGQDYLIEVKVTTSTGRLLADSPTVKVRRKVQKGFGN